MALATVVAVAACSRAVQQPVLTSPSSQPAATSQGNPAGIAKARADSIRRPYTAADIHFMSAMVGHHTQAVAMSRWAPTHGASAAVQRLAERIINGQQDEIAIMQQWLADRQQPVAESGPGGMKMKMNGVEHVMMMPGMLTEPQLKELDAARGKEFDRLFLVFMIRHHRGAVAMVKDLFSSYGAGQDETVFKFASDVNVDQATEIDRMEKMLASLTLGISFP